MFTRTRILALVIIILTATSGWLGYMVYAGSATNRNTIVTPGSNTVPCAYSIFIDGSNYDARDCTTGDIVCINASDAALTINCADNNLLANGGIIDVQTGVYTLNSPIKLISSNVYLQGEGGSADNAASYPNAAYSGTILLASNTFPAGTFANPHYLIYVGGNGLVQTQGGGISRMTLGNLRGYSAGNIGGIALSFTLKFAVTEVTFGAFNQAISPTDYFLNGPAITFDANISNATAVGPTGGWFTVDRCEFNKNGGEEVLRFANAGISDTLISNSQFFGPSFNKGYVYITIGTGIRFDNDLFYNIGSNNTPAIWVNGKLTGLWVTNTAFEQQSIQAGAGNNAGFIQLTINADQFLDNSIGVNFLDNSYFISSSITTPMKYIYQVNQTTANCPIHELGDVVDDLGTSVIYLSNNVNANFANIVFELPSVAIGATLPVIRGPLTAGASPFTYTDNDGYPEWFNIVATNGMTAMTWKGVAVATSSGLQNLLNPGDSMILTWTTTAPTYKIIPASIAI